MRFPPLLDPGLDLSITLRAGAEAEASVPKRAFGPRTAAGARNVVVPTIDTFRSVNVVIHRRQVASAASSPLTSKPRWPKPPGAELSDPPRGHDRGRETGKYFVKPLFRVGHKSGPTSLTMNVTD